MQDDRWTTKDKLEQFRGVTDLYNSTNADAKEKISVLRKKQEKEIKNLTAQNRKIRQQYDEILHGEKKNLLPVLHSHPKIQLAFKNLNTAQIEEELKQSIFCKNKELDRLRFKRKNLEATFLKKKLELAEFQKDVEETPENFIWEQEIENQLQSISVKQNAARINQQVYQKALNILQKDAIRFDEVLDGLRKDLVHQCESILRAVEMGQNVSEELSTLQKEYLATEKSVRANMRQRDKAIRNLRAELDNIRVHGQTSLRESRTAISTTRSSISEDDAERDVTVQMIIDLQVKADMAEIEDLLKKIKIAAMVQNDEDIVPRMEEQWRQKARLLKQVSQNKEQLERMVELHNQLDVMLEVTLYHTETEEVKRLRQERQELRRDIEEEKKNLNEAQNELVKIGEQIVYIRTALLTLNLMLDLVYTQTDVVSGKGSEILFDTGSNRSESQTVRPLTQPNTDSLNLMEQVTKKVRWLVEQVGTVKKDLKKVPAVYSSEGPEERGIEDEADHIVSDMLDELEDMDDPSVPTRKFIKAESQRLLDLYENPKALFQESNIPKFKKHKCF